MNFGPIADHEVFVMQGAEARVHSALAPVARAMGLTTDDVLGEIVREMKAARDYGRDGPDPQPLHNVPQAYLDDYDSLHLERFVGVWVRYGVITRLSRLVIFAAFPPGTAGSD